jgi:hypothetical protein
MNSSLLIKPIQAIQSILHVQLSLLILSFQVIQSILRMQYHLLVQLM